MILSIWSYLLKYKLKQDFKKINFIEAHDHCTKYVNHLHGSGHLTHFSKTIKCELEQEN